VAYAPRENPKIAIAVIVESAGQGAKYAAPIASFIVEKYLKGSISQRESGITPEYFMNQNTLPDPSIYTKAKKPAADSAKNAKKLPVKTVSNINKPTPNKYLAPK
jgi:penicillin-binding protein 2